MSMDSTTPAGEPGNDQPEPSNWGRYAEFMVALGLLAMGIVILVDLQDIRVPRAFSSVGPRVFPTVVGWGLIVIGVWYVIDVALGHAVAPSADSDDADPTLPADWAVMGGIAFSLVVYALLMESAGFVVASAALFTIAAYAMGSRRYVRDIAIAVAVSLITFFAFSEWLGIRLPYGILEPFFG